MTQISLQVFETGFNTERLPQSFRQWTRKINTHKKQNLTYWWGFLCQFGPCAQQFSPAPLSWTAQRPKQQHGKKTLWHFPLGNRTKITWFYKPTSTHDQANITSTSELIAAQYEDRAGLSNSLPSILIAAESTFHCLPLEYCALYCTFIFSQSQREFSL